jgi:hypothetical protein
MKVKGTFLSILFSLSLFLGLAWGVDPHPQMEWNLYLGGTGTASASACGSSPYQYNDSLTTTDYILAGRSYVYQGLYQYSPAANATLCKVSYYNSANGGTPGAATVRVWTTTLVNATYDLNANICTSSDVTATGSAWNVTSVSPFTGTGAVDGNCPLTAGTNYAITVDIDQTTDNDNYFLIPINHDQVSPAFPVWTNGWAAWLVTKECQAVYTVNEPAVRLYKME